GSRAHADARVVAPGRYHLDLVAAHVHAARRQAQAGGRLERHRHHHLLPAGDAADDAAGVVAEEALRARFVAVQAAALHDAGEAVADLDALGGVDGHHRGGDLGVELAVHRFAPARGHAAGDHADPRPDRIAG